LGIKTIVLIFWHIEKIICYLLKVKPGNHKNIRKVDMEIFVLQPASLAGNEKRRQAYVRRRW